ncbi:hypothetical protein NDU88_005997 [Pleurodeles waltl]|uniref:Uncharacterized protein n=1 Tax=Pleurodeles waltl TaxID=8319 RepID=A0AAV7LP77_PLEWA|nr:hypothetical protein NDU88_005997 [Pleurodeles waltl]
MSGKGDSVLQAPEVPTAQHISQEYTERFLTEIQLEIASLKTDINSYMQDLCSDITEVGTHVDNLECTIDSHTEDQEMSWCRMAALVEQQIEPQAKQEDLENCSSRNKVCMSGSPEAYKVMTS